MHAVEGSWGKRNLSVWHVLGVSLSPSSWTLMRPRANLKGGQCTPGDTVNAPKCFQMQQQMPPRLTLTYLGCQIISHLFSPPLVLIKTSLLSLVSLRVSPGNAHFTKTRTGSCTPCPSPDNSSVSFWWPTHTAPCKAYLSLSPFQTRTLAPFFTQHKDILLSMKEDCVPWIDKYCTMFCHPIFLPLPYWPLQVHFPDNPHQDQLLFHSKHPTHWIKSHATLGWCLKLANKSCLSPHSPNTALSGPSGLNAGAAVGNHLLKTWISMLSIRTWKQRWLHLICPDVLHLLLIQLIQPETLETSCAKLIKWLTNHVPLTVPSGQPLDPSQPGPPFFLLTLFHIWLADFLSFLPSRFM